MSWPDGTLRSSDVRSVLPMSKRLLSELKLRGATRLRYSKVKRHAPVAASK